MKRIQSVVDARIVLSFVSGLRTTVQDLVVSGILVQRLAASRVVSERRVCASSGKTNT
jgi:hypothetical protein